MIGRFITNRSTPGAAIVFSALFAACSPPADQGAETAAASITVEPDAVAAASNGRDIPGARADKSCIHQVPDGATVASDGTVRVNGRVVAKWLPCSVDVVPHKRPGAPVSTSRIEDDSAVAFPKGPCPAPHGTCAGFFDGLQSAWTVPASPTSSGALIYLFAGVASSDGVTTINSVLQYGNNGIFGGNFWSVSSWYVSKNNVFFTDPVRFSPGDTISAGLFGAGCTRAGACSWSSDAAGGPNFPNLTVAVKTPLVTAYRAVLEAFHLSACDRLPASGSTVFDFTIATEPDANLDGQDEIEEDLTWIPSVTPGVSPSCGYAVTDDFFSATLTY
jgi:hypothetical protein